MAAKLFDDVFNWTWFAAGFNWREQRNKQNCNHLEDLEISDQSSICFKTLEMAFVKIFIEIEKIFLVKDAHTKF